MNCYCPKCSARITPPLTDVPAGGAFLKCPECNAGFNLQKESFARRALHKGAETSCANCGSQLGATIYCQGCHAVYPDYYVTETSSAAKQKFAKLLAPLKGSGKKVAPGQPFSYDKKPIGTPVKTTRGGKGPGKSLQLAVAIIILLALICGGGFYYYQDKTENEYAAKYVRVLYGIKTSADYCITLNTKRLNDWRANQTPTPPPLTSQEQKALLGGKTDLETVLKRIEKAPEKFAPNHDAIKKYHESYLKLNTFMATQPSSLDSYAVTAKKLEDDFRKTGNELKAGLPPKIADRLAKSLEQYKNLKDL